MQRILRLKDFLHAPAIKFPNEKISRDAIFMVDTGAASNLIKKNQLFPDALVDSRHLLHLTEITEIRVTTLGLVKISVHGHAVEFYVIPDKFPIPQDRDPRIRITPRRRKNKL